MQTYETAMNIMAERFGKDTLIAIATTEEGALRNRMVDAYYEDGAFYVATYGLSNKMRQIEKNPDVAVCSADWFSGQGIGENLGWALAPENAEIRLKLREAFAVWYDLANNEQDKNCCFLKIRLTTGMLIKDHHALRYQIDFTGKSAKLSENWGEFK